MSTDQPASEQQWTIEGLNLDPMGFPRQHRVTYWQGGVQSHIFLTMLREDADWLVALQAAADERDEAIRDRNLQEQWAMRAERDKYDAEQALAAANARLAGYEATGLTGRPLEADFPDGVNYG